MPPHKGDLLLVQQTQPLRDHSATNGHRSAGGRGEKRLPRTPSELEREGGDKVNHQAVVSHVGEDIDLIGQESHHHKNKSLDRQNPDKSGHHRRNSSKKGKN